MPPWKKRPFHLCSLITSEPTSITTNHQGLCSTPSLSPLLVGVELWAIQKFRLESCPADCDPSPPLPCHRVSSSALVPLFNRTDGHLDCPDSGFFHLSTLIRGQDTSLLWGVVLCSVGCAAPSLVARPPDSRIRFRNLPLPQQLLQPKMSADLTCCLGSPLWNTTTVSQGR